MIKTKEEAIQLLDGSINSAMNDDLHAERDRLLSLILNISLDTKEYRQAVKSLAATNDTIERLVLNQNR